MTESPEDVARHHALLDLAAYADRKAAEAVLAHGAAAQAKAGRDGLEYLQATARFWAATAERARRSPGYEAGR